MSQPTELPPDQNAVLSLLLRQHKTYAQVAGMLGIEESSVRERAYAAISALGASEGTSLLRTHRQEIADYLLWQRGSLSESTRTYLGNLPGARTWTNTVRSQLQSIATSPLPEIPRPEHQPLAPSPDLQPPAALAGPQEDHPATIPSEQHPPAEPPSSAAIPPSITRSGSRRTGALLLGAIVVIVVVAVVLIVNGSGGSSSTSSKSTASTKSSGTSSTSTEVKPKVDAQINLTSPESTSEAKGVVQVVSEDGKRAFLIAAEDLPPSAGKGFFYAVWLYNSPSDAEPLGKAPKVTSSGRLQAAESLPSDAGKFHKLILTRETSERPTQPGPIVLEGAFKLN